MRKMKTIQVKCPVCRYVFYVRTSNKTQVSIFCPKCKTYLKLKLR